MTITAAASELPVHAEAVVADETGVARAILKSAGDLNPDWVVVGTRKRGWFSNLRCGNVADDIVDRSSSSVLVVPLDPIRRLPTADNGELDDTSPSAWVYGTECAAVPGAAIRSSAARSRDASRSAGSEGTVSTPAEG